MEVKTIFIIINTNHLVILQIFLLDIQWNDVNIWIAIFLLFLQRTTTNVSSVTIDNKFYEMYTCFCYIFAVCCGRNRHNIMRSDISYKLKKNQNIYLQSFRLIQESWIKMAIIYQYYFLKCVTCITISIDAMRWWCLI